MMKMALLPSGSSGVKDAQLIEIETPYFNLYFKGAVKTEGIGCITAEDRALYKVNCEDEAYIKLFNIEETRTKSYQTLAIPLFFEQTAYQVVLYRKSEAKVQFDHDSLLIRERITAVSEDVPIQMGVINFGNEIGMTEFRILVEDKVYLRLTLEIYPTKMSYKADYLKLREDVAQEIYNLTFDFMRRTYLGASLKASEHPSLTEFFSIFKEQFEAFSKAIQFITKQPHHELIAYEEIKAYKNGASIGPKGIKYLNQHPQQVVRQDGLWTPRKVLQVRKQLTMDVYENQMVKYMMNQILKKLQKVKAQYRDLQREKDPVVMNFLNQQIHGLEAQLSGNFFKEISKLERMQQFSIVLQMSPVYQKFYKLYLILQKGLSITADLFQISNKNIAELYEYWCFIKLGSILKEKHTLMSTDFIKANGQGLFIQLKKGKASEMRFKHRVTGEIFTLAYNQKLQQGPTVVQKPDHILSLKKEMSEVTYRYVLDAKYKIAYQQNEGQLLAEPKEEDINTMHRYRDAIVYENKEQNVYERNVFGGIILFPGTVSEAYKNSRFYQSIQKVNIGALPFLPSETSLVEQFLDEIIDRIGHSEYEQIPKTAGMEEYIKDLQIEERDVLVGPLRSKEQLERCLEYKLYHTPYKRTMDDYRPKYVALYEGQSLKTMPKGGIRYIGKVKHIRQVQRKELLSIFPTQRDNLEELYLVYEIEEWIKREKPILPGGQGVRRPNYTNHVLLKYAKTIPELYIKDKTEFEFILQLRRIFKELAMELTVEDQLILKQGERQVYVDKRGKIIIETPLEKKEFTMEEFKHSPRKIYKALKDK